MLIVRNQLEYDHITNNKVGRVFNVGYVQYRIKEKDNSSDYWNKHTIIEEIETKNYFRVSKIYSNKAYRYEFNVQQVKPVTQVVWKKV